MGPVLKRIACTGLMLATLACTSASRSDRVGTGAFDIAVFGDMPYVTSEAERDDKTRQYNGVLTSLAEHRLHLAVHIGDFAWAGQCSDSLYAVRKGEFDRFPHPLIYLFGDNEWTDCTAPYAPDERLAVLRRTFAAPGSGTLGLRTFPVLRQSGDPAFTEYSENTRWDAANVLFITINVVGSNNNRGGDSTASAEHVRRTRANVQWLRDSFAAAHRSGAIGVAVFMHANPFPSAAARAARPNGFEAITSALLELALAYGRPVALVHGDTHYFRVDKPFVQSETQRVYARLTRAETFGDPNAHWLRVRVDPRDPEVFSFHPVLVRDNVLGRP